MVTISNLRIVAKLMMLVAMMASVSLLILVIGYGGIDRLAEDTEHLYESGTEMRRSEALARLAAGLAAVEYRIVSGKDEVVGVRKELEDQIAQFERQLTELRRTADERQAALIDEIAREAAEYRSLMKAALQEVADQGGQMQLSAEQRGIVQSVAAGHAALEVLQADIHALTDYTAEKGEQVHLAAQEDSAVLHGAMVGVAGGGIAVGIGIAWLLAHLGIAAPIRRSVAVLQRLSDGDLEVDVGDTGRRDEVGDIARTASVFKDSLIRSREMQAEVRAAEQRATEERRKARLDLAERLDDAVRGIVEAVSSTAVELEASAAAMSSVAEETSRQSAAVAAASEQASANVQSVAGAADELSSSIIGILQQVSGATRMAKDARAQAETAASEVKGLNETASRIGEVVDLITAIAAQTNLLALNATIEAARAGEAGKGFAVVANEVKALAGQTARATDEISRHIDAVQRATQHAVATIDVIGATIRQLNDVSDAVAVAVEEQNAATLEIARNVDQAALGTRDVSSNIEAVRQAAGESGAAASQVLSSAGELSQQATVLKGQIRDFIATIRAA
ncbi:MAG: methyl-accepting chemotaxis protein [Caenispirillum bisanense]|nr:methyl-accepting chemotaxis protein [Caenispirillum bisanense]MCA1972655.1 methyl-accepting chemotaxis protein [Caenispirillum sp.]